MINYKYGTYAAKSVVGLVRTNNEDVFCVDAEKSLFVLADGMGGHSRGELASSEATKTIMNFIAGWRSKGNDLSGKNGIEIVQQAFHAANSELEKRNGDARGRNAMGTTLSLLAINDDKSFIAANVGDSPILAFFETDSKSKIHILSQEHTLKADLIRRGAPQNVMFGSRSLGLTRSIGTGQSPEPHIAIGNLTSGDRMILCSDGVGDTNQFVSMLSKTKIYEQGCDDFVNSVIMSALDLGGNDNCTCIVVDFIP